VTHRFDHATTAARRRHRGAAAAPRRAYPHRDDGTGSFNVFDATIVIASLSFYFTDGGGSSLAVGRLLRLVKVTTGASS
jgi:hypothetical protein